MSNKPKSATIESLTPEQEAQFDTYVTRWIAIGLDAKPADRPRAERAVLALYAQELPDNPPPTLHWALSPDQALREIRAKGMEPVWFFGQHAARWLAFYEYMREVLGLVQETQDMVCLFELARSCGWVSQHEHDVWLVERPRIQVNQAGDLHSTTGPAVEFPDGVRDYMFEGTIIPEAWITAPDTVDMRTVLTQANASVRSAGIRLFGWGRILEAFPERKVLDSDPRLHMGTLIQVDLPGAPASRLLTVTCPTGRHVAIMVPPDTNTALQAQAWINRTSQEKVLALVSRT